MNIKMEKSNNKKKLSKLSQNLTKTKIGRILLEKPHKERRKKGDCFVQIGFINTTYFTLIHTHIYIATT